QSSQSLWNRLSVLLNLLPSAADLQESGLALCNEVKDVLSGAELPDLKANLLLPEDVALRNLPPLKNAHKRFNFEQDRPIFSAVEEVSRHKSQISAFPFLEVQPLLAAQMKINFFCQKRPKLIQKLFLRWAAEEARRNRLMRDMAQLRLQVGHAGSSLKTGRVVAEMSKTRKGRESSLLPSHTGSKAALQRQDHVFAFFFFFFLLVIDGLDFLKKENAGARDSIRYLEAEFKKGNRYIRCQKDVGKSFERHKLKRQDLDAWNLYKILDSCKQLTVSQGSGEDDTTGMVTIITGFQLEDPSTFSAPMQSAIQAAANASVEIKNVLEFYKQWKEMG
ncbi:SMG5 protein, partial [Pterocles burchelli]|nr:SMG5 protein [Pterocles burchelli]